MVRGAKTEAVGVCLDADVLVAGLFSRTGASHAILVLAELGLFPTVVPDAAVQEVRRHVSQELPEALGLFDEFLRAVAVRVYSPSADDLRRARPLAHPKDVPILAAAIGAGATILVTHNVRHFRSGEGVRVVRPRTLMAEARAWMSSLGR